MAIRTQDENFDRIQHFDQSIVGHVNTLLQNEVTHDKNIRKMYHLLKTLGHFIDNANQHHVFFNLRLQQGEYIKNELKTYCSRTRYSKGCLASQSKLRV